MGRLGRILALSDILTCRSRLDLLSRIIDRTDFFCRIIRLL